MYRFLKLTSTLLMMAVFFLVTPATAGSETEPKELTSSEDLAKLKVEKQRVEQWAVDFMVQKVPPGTKVYYPEGQETYDEGLARYKDIARDVVEVAFDPKTKVPFTGRHARTQTAAVILGIMFHESSFMKHVDYGLGKYAQGDNGRSWCMMQMNIGEGRTLKWNSAHDRKVRWNDPKEEIFQGYTGRELVEDRTRCIREGLKVIRLSFNACRNLDITLRLAAYASGSCEKGHDKSLVRMGTALKLFHSTGQQRKQFSDANVSVAVAAQIQKNETNRLARERKKQKEQGSEKKVAQTDRPKDES